MTSEQITQLISVVISVLIAGGGYLSAIAIARGESAKRAIALEQKQHEIETHAQEQGLKNAEALREIALDQLRQRTEQEKAREVMRLEYERQLDELRAQLTGRDEQMEKLAQDLETTQNELKITEGGLQKLRSELAEKDAALLAEKQKNGKLSEEVNTLRGQINRLQERVAELEKTQPTGDPPGAPLNSALPPVTPPESAP